MENSAKMKNSGLTASKSLKLNSTQPKERSIVGVVINRWLPICLNLFSLDHLYYPKRCIRSDMAGLLPSNWSYTWSQRINFSILLDSRSHLAKTLFILHNYLKYIKCVLNYRKLPAFYEKLHKPPYEKLKPLKSGFIENLNFENNRDPCDRTEETDF